VRALHRQTLRLEEHDDPNHPVVAAKQRIEELTSRQAATEHAIQDIEARRPQGIRPDEVEAMLDAVPDLRDELRQATPDELAKLLEAFDVTATYDKADHQLHLAATVPGELVSENEKPRPPKGRASGDSFIAGGRYGPISDRPIVVESRVAPALPGLSQRHRGASTMTPRLDARPPLISGDPHRAVLACGDGLDERGSGEREWVEHLMGGAATVRRPPASSSVASWTASGPSSPGRGGRR
jgi:hypothetical protein